MNGVGEGARDASQDASLSRYEVRAATLQDHADLCELAQYLDTVNLPRDPLALRDLLLTSEASFRAEISDSRQREFVFVLRDLQEDRAVGTSMVIGQLGSRDAPYIYFDVHEEERYSATLDRHFVHRVLTIGYSYAGPTEIGGLVLHPDYRRSPLKLGKLISHVRFLWIGLHRAQFQDQVVAELLPPLESDGTSHLWEAVGRRFTGLSYREADRLSKRNKEFIRGLFPAGDIYVSLLSDEAQALIGEVGAQTRGVEKMLTEVGFEYAGRVDPFDGGPHFEAETDHIRPVREGSQLTLQVSTAVHEQPWLVAGENFRPPYFRAVLVAGTPVGGALQVGAADAARTGWPVAWCVPYR